jgi:hypothetical protein
MDIKYAFLHGDFKNKFAWNKFLAMFKITLVSLSP